MKIEDVPFCTIDWNKVESTVHQGITGEAYWKTFEIGNRGTKKAIYHLCIIST